jgi:hypothetical protein
MGLHISKSWKSVTTSLSYYAKLSFIIEGQIKILHDEKNLKEFIVNATNSSGR